MSIEINHEKVGNKLAIEIAELKYQVAVYSTLVEDMQEKLQNPEGGTKDADPNVGNPNE